jgi:5S rRNA maturation endonuclease (ribonuclease M5)
MPRSPINAQEGTIGTAEKIASALPKRRKSGTGYVACCPAHSDDNPSLSITERDGKPLVCCHAGCSQEAVITALKALGLWPEREHRSEADFEAIYNYTDEQGNLLYQVVRKAGKKFLQRRPDGCGWIWRKHPQQVLYHLPEVRESPIVFVCEGEKDCETLRAHGFVATTNAGGAKAPWLPEFTEALRGREVIIVPDNDAPGWERAAVIAKALIGSAVRIRVHDLPRSTKDISDWFAAGHSDTELIALLEGVDGV